ncbi:uncharacterized protein [Rhodnius prolixus]|uniref:uncharacterized protein n=1 Tax=Rhodnius prolixus TaxID=13249 RepID=UPI003D1893A0
MNFKKSFEVSPELKNLLPVRPKKPTRNFLLENVKNLRQMQQQISATKKVLEVQAKQKSSVPKCRSEFTVLKGINKPVWIKYNQSTVEKKLTGRSANSSTSVIDFVDDAPLKKNSTPKQFTDQGIQTSPPKLQDTIDNESSNVNLTSPKLIKAQGNISKNEPVSRDSSINTNEKTINKVTKDAVINFVELNRRMEYKCKISKEKPDPNGIPQNYQLGELPRYLKDRKKTNILSPEESEEASATSNERLIEHPPLERDARSGYVLLSDEERLEHLKMMNKHYEDLLLQFNQLPVRSDSLKARQRRSDLEKQLENMEHSMKLFSKQKLYIKL